LKNMIKVSCSLLAIMLVTNAYAAKSADGEKIDLSAIEARLTALEDGVKTRADAGLYMVTQTEVGLNGSCNAPGIPSISHQAIRNWAIMLPNGSDPDRMDLILNWKNSDGSLTTFRSDFELSGGFINEDALREVDEGDTTATVFIEGGEITLDPDTSNPWDPTDGEKPPHFNNQSVWGGMSDDGSMFTIVAHLTTEIAGYGTNCDRASLITVVGARQRAF